MMLFAREGSRALGESFFPLLILHVLISGAWGEDGFVAMTYVYMKRVRGRTLNALKVNARLIIKQELHKPLT